MMIVINIEQQSQFVHKIENRATNFTYGLFIGEASQS
jgi:hypothetical protein